MNGLDAALVVALLVALTVGVGIGVVLAARNPATWTALGSAVAKAVLPKIQEMILKRNPPEIEKKMHECLRRGGTWDNFRKRCRD